MVFTDLQGKSEGDSPSMLILYFLTEPAIYLIRYEGCLEKVQSLSIYREWLHGSRQPWYNQALEEADPPSALGHMLPGLGK